MKLAIAMALAVGLLPQGQARRPKTAVQNDKEQSAQRLEFMKESVAVFDIYLGKERETKLRLRAEPVLRWNNPVTGVKDGTVFVWTADGRPEVVGGVFHLRARGWLLELTSFSLGPNLFQRHKQPWASLSKAAVELKPIPDAPSPAKTKLQRLTQIRSMARDFTAASNRQDAGWWELRLMSQPLYRYGKPGSEILDGALFAFVQGTNPEVLLLLEARSREAGYQWHYALGPMTYFAVRASLKRAKVWSLPKASTVFKHGSVGQRERD